MRDCSIHIFHSYLEKYLLKTTSPKLSIYHQLKVIAIGCYLLSFKLQDLHSSSLEHFLKKVYQKFPSFNKKLLVDVEIHILQQIDYNISPYCSPSLYYRYFFTSPSFHEKFLSHVDKIVGDCLIDSHFLQFSPSTIGIASVVFCCTFFELDCNEWLRHLPSICFFAPKRLDLQSTLDVSSCVDLISTSHLAQSQPLQSPISITYSTSVESSATIFDEIMVQSSTDSCDSLFEVFAGCDVSQESVSEELCETVSVKCPAPSRKRSMDDIYELLLQPDTPALPSKRPRFDDMLETILKSVAYYERRSNRVPEPSATAYASPQTPTSGILKRGSPQI